MKVVFKDLHRTDNPLNGKTVETADELRALMASLNGERPFFFELVGHGQKLLIGFGQDASCAQHSVEEGAPPYLMAVENNEHKDGSLMFWIGNEQTEVPAAFAVGKETLRQIVEHFCDTGEPWSGVSWEEI